MKRRTTAARVRRQPRQPRAKATVDAMLDAVARVLETHGIDGVTTNRIAEAAGVSIGSVYQYFPDKRAIFTALHDRHVDEVGRVLDERVVSHAAAPIEDVVRALVEALVEAHAAGPAFYQLMTATVAHGVDDARALHVRLRGVFERALTSRGWPHGEGRDLNRVLFVVPNMVEALSHAVAHRRPSGLSIRRERRSGTRRGGVPKVGFRAEEAHPSACAILAGWSAQKPWRPGRPFARYPKASRRRSSAACS